MKVVEVYELEQGNERDEQFKRLVDSVFQTLAELDIPGGGRYVMRLFSNRVSTMEVDTCIQWLRGVSNEKLNRYGDELQAQWNTMRACVTRVAR